MYEHIKSNVPIALSATIDISVDADLSASIDLEDHDLVGIITPANFDGTDIVLHGSADNSTFVPIAASNGAATAYTIVTTASTGTPIAASICAGFRYIKIETTTDQTTTDTVFTLLLRKRT